MNELRVDIIGYMDAEEVGLFLAYAPPPRGIVYWDRDVLRDMERW